MLQSGCPTVFGFRRKENREGDNENGEKTESELANEYRPLVPLLGSCSGSTKIATDRHMKDSNFQVAKKRKAATSEKTYLSDSDHRTKAVSMIGSSSSSSNIDKIILGFKSGRVHTQPDVEERVPNLAEQESKLEEVCSVAPGRPKSTKALRDLEDLQAEVAEFKILDQQHDKLAKVSRPVRKGCGSVSGKSKSEGGETESEFPDQDYVRITRLNRSPIFGFWSRPQDRQEGQDLDLECELSKGQEQHGISCVAASSSFVHTRGKQLRRDRHQSSPNPIDAKAISLPDEMVEKILAMVPFPDILKTRVLNKSWNTNFSASPDAVVFQNQVRAVSAKWKHYCPIILNIEKEWLVGYDREYNRWQTIPLRFEREVLSNQKLRGAGSLMCGVFNGTSVFVTNIVTRTWKSLPSRPDMAYPKEIHLLSIGAEAYQVLLITKYDRKPTKVLCQLYDSRTKFWTIRRSTVSTTLSNSSSVYLNGVLYVMEYDPDDFHDVMRLLSYNVSDGTWTNIHHPFGSMLHEIETYELLVCQNRVMVVLHVHPTWWTTNLSHNTLRNTLMVYKLDPDSLDIREVARGPPEPMSATCTLFASDNDCIYFGDPQVASSSVVELNVQNREWSCLPAPTCADGSFKNKWATFSFQPGMNPFVSV